MRELNRKIALWVWRMVLAVGIAGEVGAEDWKGEKVFPRQKDLALRYEERTVGTFSSEAWVVRDLDEWIEVRHAEGAKGYLGCVRKEEVVRAGDAVDYFTGVIREQPDSSWAYVNRGKAWLIRGERSIALKDLDEGLRLDPRGANYNWRGNLKLQLKDYTGAIRDYDEAIRLEPKYDLAYNNRGNAKRSQKDYAGAIADYDEAIRLNSKFAGAYNGRGSVKASQKDHAGAIRDFEEAMRLDPEYALPYNNRGYVKSLEKDYEGAIRDYNEAIRIDSKHIIAYKNRGDAKTAQQDYAGAIRDFDEALRLDPKDAAVYCNRGNAKRDLQDYAGALRDYDEALRLDLKDAAIYYNRGWTKHIQKDYAGAIGDYREAIRLDEKLILSRNNYAFLLATAADEKFRDAGEAMKVAEGVLKEEPTNGYGKSAKACALALRGDFVEAIRWEREALQDAGFAQDGDVDGGKLGYERIAAWKQKKLWLQP